MTHLKNYLLYNIIIDYTNINFPTEQNVFNLFLQMYIPIIKAALFLFRQVALARMKWTKLPMRRRNEKRNLYSTYIYRDFIRLEKLSCRLK